MEPKQKPIGPAKTNPVDPQITPPPMALAELEIMKADSAKSVANKSPEVRNIAALLAAVLGLGLFGQIISYLIVKSFNTETSFFAFFASSNGVLGIAILLVQVIAIFILLFTKNISRAKTIILIAGIGFGVALVSGIFSFRIGPSIMTDLAILVVNILLVRKIFKAYLEL